MPASTDEIEPTGPLLPANLVENAAPPASLHEIAKRTQYATRRNYRPLVKRALDAIDTACRVGC